jgi:hypothetical protein
MESGLAEDLGNCTRGWRVLLIFFCDFDYFNIFLSRSPFELGKPDDNDRLKVKQTIPKIPKPRVAPPPALVKAIKGNGKGKGKDTMDIDKAAAVKRAREEEEASDMKNKKDTKIQRTDNILDGARDRRADNQPDPDEMSPEDQAITQLHCLYGFIHLVLLNGQSPVLLQFTRTLYLITRASTTIEEIQAEYKKWLNVLANHMKGTGWHRTIHGMLDQVLAKSNHGGIIDALFIDLNKALGPIDKNLEKAEVINNWISVYKQDPYMTDGVSNDHVYSWPNLVSDSNRPYVIEMVERYIAFLYYGTSNTPTEPPKKALTGEFFLYHFSYNFILDKLNNYKADPNGNSTILFNNILTELMGEIAVRILDNNPIDRTGHISQSLKDLEERIYRFFNEMPIEFFILVLYKHHRYVHGDREGPIKNTLSLRLGLDENKVYGPIKDRVNRIWKRIETVHYLNPESFWVAWARVRHNNGKGPYEYQWATAIPLIRAEVSENILKKDEINEQERVNRGMRGGYLALDPGTGKTLLGLVITVLSSLLSGSTKPTMIVLPQTLIDEWIDDWNKFFGEEARRMFPIFVYERYEAKPRVGNGTLHDVINAETGKFERRALPPNAILLVKRGQMEKFSPRKYDRKYKGGDSTRVSIERDLRAKPNNLLDLMKVDWQRIIVDEGHTFPNRETFAFEGLYNLIEPRPMQRIRPFVYILSGTPIVNNVIDLVSQLRLIGFKIHSRPEFTPQQKNILEIEWNTSLKLPSDKNNTDGDEGEPDVTAGLYGDVKVPGLTFGESDDEEEGEGGDNEVDVLDPDHMILEEVTPFYDRVGDMREYVVNTKARSKLRQLVFQTEFDILFTPDMNGKRSLDMEKLFGYYYQLFVDDTPQYQRKAAPVETLHPIPVMSMTSDTLPTPQRALFDMLYPFMNVKSARGYGLPQVTQIRSPYYIKTFDEDAIKQDDDATEDSELLANIADELFGRHVFYEQWKNQFLHTTIVNRYSLVEEDKTEIFALKTPSTGKKAKKKDDIEIEQRKIEYIEDEEREMMVDEMDRAVVEEDDDGDEGENDIADLRPKMRIRKRFDESILFNPNPNNPDDQEWASNWAKTENAFGRLRLDRDLWIKTLHNEKFIKVLFRLNHVAAKEVRYTTLPLIHKRMSFQYIRDIQMAIGYDWRLINKKLYNQLILAAIRTAIAMEHKWEKEFKPVNGGKQPLYRMWYTMGIDRLLQIADILLDNEHNVFPPDLYLAEQEQSIMNMRKDSDLAKKDKSIKTIAKFTPVIEDKEKGPRVQRFLMELENFQPHDSWGEWRDNTLIGNALEQIILALTPGDPKSLGYIKQRDDKLIVYASNDDLLSYVGLMLRFVRKLMPFKINNKTRLNDKNSKEENKKLNAKDPSIKGHEFYVHVKSAYIGVESALVSCFRFVPEVRVLLITYNKGGMGLNLQVANREIFLDSPKRYTDLRQARDRVYRNAQKKPVFIHYMLMKTWDSPIHHPFPFGNMPMIVNGKPTEPGQIQKFPIVFEEMKTFTWNEDVNDWWNHSMYAIWSFLVHRYQDNRMSEKALLARWEKFIEIYEYISKNPIMSVHELMNKARIQWQLAHEQFYPLHSFHATASPEQTHDLAFQYALLQHRLRVLLSIE